MAVAGRYFKIGQGVACRKNATLLERRANTAPFRGDCAFALLYFDIFPLFRWISVDRPTRQPCAAFRSEMNSATPCRFTRPRGPTGRSFFMQSLWPLAHAALRLAALSQQPISTTITSVPGTIQLSWDAHHNLTSHTGLDNQTSTHATHSQDSEPSVTPPF